MTDPTHRRPWEVDPEASEVEQALYRGAADRDRREQLSYAAETVGATIVDIILCVDASMLPAIAKIIVKVGKVKRSLIESAEDIATTAGSSRT